jgi:hypothetical protein
VGGKEIAKIAGIAKIANLENLVSPGLNSVSPLES